MRTIAIALRYLWARPFAALLNLLLLTLGLASITFVLLVSEQIERAFQRDLAGIDLVVGAKGSPMQLILAGVFHIDTPPGNISLKDVQVLRAQPQVAQLIPLSLGDSFSGWRIVGTRAEFLAHYGVRFAQGDLWSLPLQAVLGADVARASGMKVGDRFSGSHGLAGGVEHGESSYRVSGVLQACGCVVDRLIVTATESVWQVHQKHPAAPLPVQAATPLQAPQSAEADSGVQPMQDAAPAQQDAREITMALVTYRTPLAAATLRRWVNSRTGMQAAAPVVEVTRMLQLMGVGSEVLRGVGAVLLLTAALSVFIAFWNAARERRGDLAMLRMLGATPAKVALLLLAEALVLAVLASALGLAAGHALAGAVGHMLEARHSLPVTGALWLPSELWIPVAAIGVATVAALIPVVSASRVDVAQLLNAR